MELESTPFILAEIERQRPDEAARITSGFTETTARPVTLRANTLRATRDEVAAALEEAGLSNEGVSWYEDAFVIRDVRERAIWDLPLYQRGDVYLQSLSSMLPPLILAPQPGTDVLDMCAAPGGKTSQLAAVSGGRARITACELHAPRAEKLEHNLAKLGVGCVNVMRTDARRLDTFFSFDQVLLDAPCTGSGTLRADDARGLGRITPKLLAQVTRSQRALLDRALTVLKPGGTLVYATCSVLPQENDEQIETALAHHRDCALTPLSSAAASDAHEETPALPASAQAIVDAAERDEIPVLDSALAGTLTVCPTRDYEGFFLACITKRRAAAGR